jgi:hypothetical protein
MRTNNMTLETTEIFIVRLACGFASTALLLLFLIVMSFASTSFAQQSQPKAFSSPGEASDALFQAAKGADETALEAILGAGKEITSSNDDVEDKLEREQFCKKYQEMHRLVQEPDGNTVLYIGAENWPFPVQLVSKNGEWHFDADRGRQEILFRRIGENEATAIEVTEEFAMANNAGATKAASEDPITQFAESLAAAGAANADNKEPSLFHGYYFRIVNVSSAAATSRYVSPSDKNNGLTLVAYPAEYQSSGVKTFIVSEGGVVYEKDLGPGTMTVAPQIKTPTGSNWRPAV